MCESGRKHLGEKMKEGLVKMSSSSPRLWVDPVCICTPVLDLMHPIVRLVSRKIAVAQHAAWCIYVGGAIAVTGYLCDITWRWDCASNGYRQACSEPTVVPQSVGAVITLIGSRSRFHFLQSRKDDSPSAVFVSIFVDA